MINKLTGFRLKSQPKAHGEHSELKQDGDFKRFALTLPTSPGEGSFYPAVNAPHRLGFSRIFSFFHQKI
jgi:hypothetical protein